MSASGAGPSGSYFQTQRRSIFRGVGAALPSQVVTNEALAAKIDTSDDWIRARTGIRERRIAEAGELTSDLGARAALQALERAGVAPADVDLLILATATPDQTFPASAVIIQDKIGMTGGVAFDVHAVCSGFVFALATADQFLRSGMAQTAVVIGAETFSRILDWEDRTTCVLFGDGAGAVVLQACDSAGRLEDRGVLAAHLRSDGKYRDLLYVDGGPSLTQSTGHLRMSGREVFRHAVTKISQSILDVLEPNGLTIGDVDLFVPHQANERIISAVADRLGLDPAKVVNTVGEHGNTSAASIPLALAQAAEQDRIAEGDLVLFEALGGGLTWGSVLARW